MINTRLTRVSRQVPDLKFNEKYEAQYIIFTGLTKTNTCANGKQYLYLRMNEALYMSEFFDSSRISGHDQGN